VGTCFILFLAWFEKGILTAPFKIEDMEAMISGVILLSLIPLVDGFENNRQKQERRA